MKSKIKKIALNFVFIFMLAIVAHATIYSCFNGSCLTMIDDSGDGFRWAITCNDGSFASGHTSGAEYGGECRPIM